MKRYLRLALGIGLSVLGLVAAARSVDPAQVSAALVGVNYLWLLTTLLFVMGAVWLRAVRWRRLFTERQHLPTSKLFGITMIGYLINTVLPARLGDPARAVLAADLLHARMAQALATIVVERLLDVLTLIVLLATLLPVISLPPWIGQSASIMAAGAVVAFAALIVIGRVRDRLLPGLEVTLRRLPERWHKPVAGQAGHLLSGTDALAVPGNAVVVVALCLVVWLCSVGQIFTVMLAFGLQVPITAAVLLVVVSALGMVVPSSPGYIGVYHYLVVETLALFGVERSLALSFAIVAHLITFLPLSLIGAVYLWRESLSLGRVSARAARLEG